MNSAEVMTPSVPSFCSPGTPPSALLVMSFQSPFLRISPPERVIRFTAAPSSSSTSKVTVSSGRILRSWWSVRRTVQRRPLGMAIRQESRLSMQVPHSTQSLPPAFSAMLPPTVQAQALVGSVAKTSPRSSANSMAFSVMTPASSSSTWALAVVPSRSERVRRERPRMWLSFSVLTTTQSARSGTAPPVSPVPAPRGTAFSPSRPMAARVGATCASWSGMTTASGRWSRQSVASVACDTSVNGSKRTFSLPAAPPSSRARRRRRSGRPSISARKRVTSPRQAASTSCTSGSPAAPRSMTVRSFSMCSSSRRRRRGESTSSCSRKALRRWTRISPSTRMSRRAERPVTRLDRSVSSLAQTSPPSRKMTACRSSAEV